MKHLLPLLALLPSLLFAQVWDGTADTTWYTDNKNETGYTITTAEQLAGLARLVNGGTNNGTYNMSGKTITLGADINLGGSSNKPWTAIGTVYYDFSFSGTFDGGGHVVRGVYISGSDYNQGLFGVVLNGTIKNLGVVASYIKGANAVGGLVGINAYGTISNSYATGSVEGVEGVGGLVGDNAYGSTISNSYATGSVNGDNKVGGLVGYNGGTISNSYATGNVVGERIAGSLVGQNFSDISNSYATGNVVGYTTKGMVGTSDYEIGTITNSYYIQTDGQIDYGFGSPRDTVQMQDQATYEGWDFTDTWYIGPGINNGMPHLISGIFPEIANALEVGYEAGLTLANVDLPAGYQWAAPDTLLFAGTGQFEAIHAISKGKVNVDVAQAIGSFVTPGPINTTYAPTLKLGDLALEPDYAWNDPATPLTAGDGQTFPAIYTDPSGNYTFAGGSITVNVAPASYPPFADVPAINAEFAENLTLADLEALPSGYSWTNPKTPIQYIGGREHEAIYTNPNYLQAAAGTVTVNVSKNPGPEPEFPAISVNATFRENLTLAGIQLPSGYAWAEPSTEIPSPSDGHQFGAIHANDYYAQPSTGIIIVNASAGAGVVAIDSWSFGEKPNTPLAKTITNGAATFLYTGKTNSGTSYSSAQPPLEAGRYTLTATFAAKDGSGEIVRTAQFTIEKSQGTGAVRIDGWKSGFEASNPLAESETNGTENVSYIYRSTDGTSYAPQPSKPSNAGNYMLIAIFPETNNHTEARDTTYFTISKPDAIELTVNWSDNSVFIYNKMVPRPVPTADHNGIQIPLIVLKTRIDAGEYKGVTEAIAMIADENLRTNYILQNSTKSYTVEKKALVPRFTVKNPIDEFDAKEDTIWVPRSIFSNPDLLSSILAELIDYAGFARDTVKNESDNASVLSGTPRVELVYENPVSPSALYRRVETTRKATAIIVTDDVSAKNYELVKPSSVTVVETVEEDGERQVSCSVNSSCAPMSGNSCSAIGGEAVHFQHK